MKFDSLAMIETNGLVSALMAVNKMTSSGNVEFLKKKIISNGQVIVFILGKSSQIKRVLDDGIIAAQKVGIVISSGIVPYPNEIIEKIISDTSHETVTPKKVLKNIRKVKEKIEILFDQKEDEKSYIDLIAKVAEKSPDIAGEILTIKHHDHKTEIIEDDVFNTVSSAELDNEQGTPNRISKRTSERITELLEEEKKINDTNDVIVENNISEDEAEDDTIENGEEELEDESISEDKIEKDEFDGMSHLERLRAEAKSEILQETEGQNNNVKLDENNPEGSLDKEENLSSDEESGLKTDAEEILESKLLKMNVPDLRKLARSIDDFPIKGREISKANKKVLMEYFKQL